MRRAAAVTVAMLFVFSLSAAAPAVSASATPELRDVMVVGNNWDGTASIVDARSFEVLRKGIDLVPDKDEEIAAIHQDPERLAMYYLVRDGPGEGNDQRVDDMFTTRDGKLLAVSRPSLADVVWIDIEKALAGCAGLRRGRAADGRPPHRPHGPLPRRHRAAGLGLDLALGARVLDGRRGRPADG